MKPALFLPVRNRRDFAENHSAAFRRELDGDRVCPPLWQSWEYTNIHMGRSIAGR